MTEVLINKNGKVEMITVGVGGFLGIGSKEVAIPFEQVTWSDQPLPAANPPPPPPPVSPPRTPGAALPPPPAAAVPRPPEMYPDHGKISLTKEQLHAAPTVTYSSQ